jgi:hypothetical protein
MLDDAAQAFGDDRGGRKTKRCGIALDVVGCTKPSFCTAVKAAASRPASTAIQSLNSPESPASACSARPTGSSMSFFSTRRSTLRSGLGCVITWWVAKDLTSMSLGLFLAMMPASMVEDVR